MEPKEILDQALKNLNPILQASYYWENQKHQLLDAKLTLELLEQKLIFNVEVKQEVREHIIRRIKELNRDYPDFLLVAYRIYPNYRELLQEMGINYIEANGNAHIKAGNIYILIDKFPTLKGVEEETNRAFTKTGLRVFFQLLKDNNNLAANQRELADLAGVALGNIPLILRGLKTAGLLVPKNKFGFYWTNKEEAIGQWVNGYRTTLKAALILGRFRLPKNKDWKDIILPTTGTFWGGEPGADLMTNYLRPEKFTLFTNLQKTDFIKTTRLMPDPNGEVEVINTFWKVGESLATPQCAPPLLVYADLIINGDKRSLETARIIYERYLTEL